MVIEVSSEERSFSHVQLANLFVKLALKVELCEK